MTDVRVRFAPSPTGPLHIGGVRTALFNYLFAKKHKGTFVLRIEDTDQKRYIKNAEDYIIESLNWCGIPFDEGIGKNEIYGPYRQSERQKLYQKHINILLQSGKAYYAFDSTDELDHHRKDHENKGKTFIYNWHNRKKGRLKNSLVMSKEEINEKLTAGEKYVVRFKTPASRTLELNDIIRGKIEIDTNNLDDKILFKSDGMPTYHLANVVDDHLMKISHVIRGEEWLPSMALHVLLYEAFEWPMPEFAHLPLILKPTGKGKLSKRDGDKLGFPVFPLAYENLDTKEWSRGYREDGYFPEAVINFLVFLGWNPGTEQEIFSLAQMIEDFDLNRVNRSGARFDPDKTKWYNHEYLQLKTNNELALSFDKQLNMRGIQSELDLTKIVELIKERASFINDFWELSSYFFEAPVKYDRKAIKKHWKVSTPEIILKLIEQIKEVESYTASNIETHIKEWINHSGLGFGKVMPPFRIAIVGALKGPDLFSISALIGKNETINRLENALKDL